MNDDLPAGWIWERLSDVTERVPGLNPAHFGEREFGYVDISSIDNRRFTITDVKRVRGKDAPSRARRPIRPGDILFSNVRTYLRNVALVPEGTDAALCSTGFTVLRPTASILPRFLFHYVLSDNFIDRVTPKQTGTHYPATSDRLVMEERIPLPPIADQRLIVGVLDEIIGAANSCREHLGRAQKLLAQLRQTILDAACSGRLTAEWRKSISPLAGDESDGDLPLAWRRVPLAAVARSFDYGTSAKSQKTGAMPVLRMGNIQDGSIDWSDLAYTSDPREIERYSLCPGTVLFNRTNSPELVGKSAIYRGEQPAIFAGYLIRINVLPELDPEYLNICLNAPYGREFCWRAKTDGVSQSNINARTLATFAVPLCPLDEQKEIVRRVSRLMKSADQAENRIARLEKLAARLMPAVLKRAFNGDLVRMEARQDAKGPTTASG